MTLMMRIKEKDMLVSFMVIVWMEMQSTENVVE